MKHILKINEFFVEGKNRQQSHVLLHITEPTTPEEKEKGYFFALAEVEHGQIEQIEHIQQMIDDLESGYYETDDLEDKNAFEVTLEYINRRGHHILDFPRSRVHAIVGAVRGGKISFAYHGQPTGLVYYQGKQGYQQLGVVDHTTPSEENQLFSAVLEGEIQVDDYFVVLTPHVAEYLSDDRLEKIITSRPGEQSANHIQKVLSNLKSDESFGGIVFHLVTKDQLPKTGKMPAHLKQGSADSLKKLISSQQHTTETLNPPMMNRAASVIGKYIGRQQDEEDEDLVQRPTKRTRTRETSPVLPETNHRTRKEEQKDSFANTLLIEFGKLLVIGIRFIGVVLQRTLLLVRDTGTALFILATDKGGQRQQVRNSIRHYIDRRRDAYVSMPLMSKILLLATIAFATVFVGSIIFLKIKEANDAKQLAYTNMTQAIIDKVDAAQASMIYSDDEKAFTLLKEAETLVAELPTSREAQREQQASLAQQVEESLMSLRKIELVEPRVLSTITSTNPTADVTKLVQLEDTLVAFGPSDTNHYLVDASTGSTEQKSHSTIADLQTASTPKENDFSLFVSGNDGLAQLDTFGNLAASEIQFPGTQTTLADIFVYNRRVYSLDTATEQIYRHNPTAAGYDRGTPWITDKTSSLEQAISLAIDGDVFVLTREGNILKFERGEETSFTIRGLDPTLNTPTQLWTYNDTQNIYILEPTNKRIIIVNKDGQLVRQLTADVWVGPTSMVVNEEDGVVFVLDNNIVYRVSL